MSLDDKTTKLHKLLKEASVDSELVSKSIQDGANPYELDGKNNNAITYAIINKHFQLIDTLLSSPISVSRQLGASVVEALSGKNPDIALKLIDKMKSDEKVCEGLSGWSRDNKTSLIFACENGYIGIVSALLEVKVDMAIKAQGKIALVVAVENGYLKIAGLLLEAGANPADLAQKEDVLLNAIQYNKTYLNRLLQSREFVISHLAYLSARDSNHLDFLLNDNQYIQPIIKQCFGEFVSGGMSYENKQQFVRFILNLLLKPRGQAFLSMYAVEIAKILMSPYQSLEISTPGTSKQIYELLEEIGKSKVRKEVLLSAFRELSRNESDINACKARFNDPDCCLRIILNVQRLRFKKNVSTSLQLAQVFLSKQEKNQTKVESVPPGVQAQTQVQAQVHVGQADELNQLSTDELRQKISYFNLLLESKAQAAGTLLAAEQQNVIQLKKEAVDERLSVPDPMSDEYYKDQVEQLRNNHLVSYGNIQNRNSSYLPSVLPLSVFAQQSTQAVNQNDVKIISHNEVPVNQSVGAGYEGKFEQHQIDETNTLQNRLAALPVPPKGEPEAQRSESPRRLGLPG